MRYILKLRTEEISMIQIDGKTYRNLEEQVRRNQQLLEVLQPALNNKFLDIKGTAPTKGDLPSPGEVGTWFLVGYNAPYELYYCAASG